MMKCFSIIFVAAFLFSCSDEPAKKTDADSIPNILQATSASSPVRKPIGSSGFSIDLPVNFKIDSTIGEHSSVYYFQPVDTNLFHGEAGIYIGSRPQNMEPDKDFYKREFSSVWLEQTVKWTEYKMNPNTQRETFVDLNDSTKIHCWCYSDRTNDLDKLFEMVNTISH